MIASQNLKILVIDAPIIRLGIISILLKEFPNASITEDTIFNEKIIGRKSWDIVISDIYTYEKDSLEILKRIKNEFPKLHLLVTAYNSGRGYAIRAYKAGALGFINKNCEPSELIKAIYKVGTGNKYISEAVAEDLYDNLTFENRKPHDILSDRELQVLVHLASGKNLTQVGELLHLALPTVSTYRARIKEKMNLNNTAQIMKYGIDHKLTVETSVNN